MLYDIIPLLILILDIYCIVMIVQGGGETTMKLIWILIVLFLPLLGPILYLLIGRGARTA